MLKVLSASTDLKCVDLQLSILGSQQPSSLGKLPKTSGLGGGGVPHF